MKKFLVFALTLSLALPAISPVARFAQAQTATFPDLNEQHPNRDAIEYLKEEGVVQGNPSGNFDPLDRINKAAFTKMLIAAIYPAEEINKCTGSEFFDVPDTEWYARYVCMAKKHGIVTGNPDGSFGPADFINFATASKIIVEAEDITQMDLGTDEQWYARYVKALEGINAIPTSISGFDQDITRAQMAEITYRVEAEVKTKVSSTYDEINNPFPAISSCQALQEKFDEYRFNQPPIYYFGMEEDVDNEVTDAVSEPAPVAAPSEPMTGGGEEKNADQSSDDYSETNTQVDGVDEADIIKNDGKYIYMIKGDTVRIVDAYPADTMKEVSKIVFGAKGFHPSELFVTDDKLVAIGQDYNYTYYDQPVDSKMAIMPSHNQQQSKVFVYDITDRAAPKKEQEVAFDGYYHTSRRIDNQVYLVLNASPNYWNLDAVKSPADLIPKMKDGDQAAVKMVDCDDIRYFPGHKTPQYLITASINIDDASASIPRNVFLGSSDNVYASKNNLFVASTYVDYDRFTDWDWTKDTTESHVYSFDLENGKVDFNSRGHVPGRILNQFSMDQHENNFRIATTTGNTWNWNGENSAKNNVYVLNEGMKQIGALEGLAPGEQIHSARFMGDRLYMVTFEQVDPLFVIDLANPSAPKVLGQLKIPGFSEYLHPYDENHILGFGQETSVVKDNVRVAGFKMSLFDVSNVAAPKQKFVEVIGDQGTYSELLYNHKALLFDKEKDLIAFPIQIQELVKPADLQCGTYTKDTCPSSCIQACIPDGNGQCSNTAGSCVAPTYEQYQNTFSGAVVYNINLEEGFSERGRITHFTDAETQKGDYWYDYNKMIQRIIYIGENLYTIAQGGIKASNLETVKEINKVELIGELNDPIMEPKPVPMSVE